MQILVNGHKPEKWKFWVHYGWLLLSYAVVIFIIAAMSKEINQLLYDWTYYWKIGPNSIYELIEEHWWGNLIIFVWLCSGIAFYVWKNWNNKYFSIHSIAFAVGLCVLLLKQKVWTYAETPIPYVRYDFLVVILSVSFVAWNVGRCFRSKCKTYREKTRKLVLTSDEIEGVTISAARKSYAKMLVDELLTSNLYDETYAVAITGGWGSGKSLFLKTVKDFLSNQAIVIDFNPWNSQDEIHLVKDFFDVLSSGLSPYYSGVTKLMSKYVSLLYSLRVHFASNFVLQHLPINEQEKLETKKQNVANALRNIQKPIVVAIDDLDRLAGKEIFEVLRIIRNTAKFNNIIYIVTYDKEHVVSQLMQPGLNIEKDYLEKIFQIELSMPKVDEKTLQEEFKLICRNGVTRTSLINSALDSMNDEDYRHILKVLSSYRKVKRFVRQFSFNTNYIISSFVDGKGLSILDVMFLNVVQVLDDQLYHRMWRQPESLFEINLHKSTRCQYYMLKEGAIKDCRTIYFMKRMFGGIPDKGVNSIQMVDAYYKYFYLSQPEKVLTDKEFNKMLKLPESEVATNGMRATIRGWVLSKDAKSASSIYACFANHKPKMHSDLLESKRFLIALFYWLEFEDRKDANINEVLPHLLDYNLYVSNIRQNVNCIVVSLMNKWLCKGSYEKCAVVLSSLYVSLNDGTKLLINTAQVKQAIVLAIDEFLKSQDWDAVLLFKGDDNLMLAVTKLYCVKLKNNGKRVNLVINELIKFFSMPEHKSKNSKQIDGYLNAFYAYKLLGDKADTSIDWKEMRSIFGDNMDLAIEYVEKCFG